MANRKSICIIALSPIARDGRVLRQIEYLAPYYDLTVVGYGPAHPDWANVPGIQWIQVSPPSFPATTLKKGALAQRMAKLLYKLWRKAARLTLYLGRQLPIFYELSYFLEWGFLNEWKFLTTNAYDAYHANDWNTLPIAAKAAQKYKAHLVVDLHEFAPLEFENRPEWWLYEPMIRYLLRKFGPKADAVMTVAAAIAERYQQELGLNPLVVMNAPQAVGAPVKTFNPEQIRLVHHGVAFAIRKPEVMIETLALCDARYTLHFMLMASPYIQVLKELAATRAPGRVFFHDAVAPEQIVPTIAEYDIGFNFIAPTNYNYLVCLPNKFFESINAGLAILTGPSPAMAEIVHQYHCGVVAPSFEPEDLAAVLNQTTAEQWGAMQQAAREAAKELNAAHEMAKVVQLYTRLFAEK